MSHLIGCDKHKENQSHRAAQRKIAYDGISKRAKSATGQSDEGGQPCLEGLLRRSSVLEAAQLASAIIPFPEVLPPSLQSCSIMKLIAHRLVVSDSTDLTAIR